MQLLYSIRLRYSKGRPGIRFRELTGHEEMSLTDTGTSSALQLINQLMVKDDSGSKPLRAEKIVTADRDHVLAMIYINVYGKKIDGTLRCRECDKPFSIDFQLPDLEEHLTSNNEISQPADDMYYVGQSSFRLPTGEDEMAVAGLDAAKATNELLRLCVTDFGEASAEKIQEAMSDIAPVMQTEMKALCPECGAAQQVRFDIQSYLLTKLRQDQKTLMRDVHRIATAYKWSHAEILELPRRLRRAYVRLIEGDMTT